MPRKKRKLYDNAWYHVMNRGTNHDDIFFDLEDRDNFISLLDYISYKYSIEIHAYCLMTNHYHLLINTPKANLDKAMKYLNSVYTMRINRKYKRDGQILRGRYHAENIEKENYFVHVSRYIHNNPVEARMTDNPLFYPWSSYRYYLDKSTKPKWLYTQQILDCFGDAQQTERYKSFVEN